MWRKTGKEYCDLNRFKPCGKECIEGKLLLKRFKPCGKECIEGIL